MPIGFITVTFVSGACAETAEKAVAKNRARTKQPTSLFISIPLYGIQIIDTQREPVYILLMEITGKPVGLHVHSYRSIASQTFHQIKEVK